MDDNTSDSLDSVDKPVPESAVPESATGATLGGSGGGEVEKLKDVKNEEDTTAIMKDDTVEITMTKEIESDDDSIHNTTMFLDDDYSQMTCSRRVALFLMRRYKWYNPKLKKGNESSENGSAEESNEFIHELTPPKSPAFRSHDGYPNERSIREIPSLEKAWAYFEHVTLPRYLYYEKNKPKKNICVRAFRRLFCKGNQVLDMADPGETAPTRLYRPFFTPHKQLGDWGLGFGLYFSNLRYLILLMIVAALMNIFSFKYYHGKEYSDHQANVPYYMVGSAVCTDVKWVPCPFCRSEMEKDIFGKDRVTLGFAYNSTSQKTLTFALQNQCNGATIEHAAVNFATIIVMILGLLFIGKYLDYMEVQLDEDAQTAQDYSIAIHNPPEDAKDPEEWKEFFEESFNAQVVGCTIAVNNDFLVRYLQERREKLKLLEMMIEPGTSMDMSTLAGIGAKIEMNRTFLQRFMAMFSPGIPEIVSEVAALTTKVQGMAQQDYPVTKVFVTFETEADQRNILSNLTASISEVSGQRLSAVNNDINFLFRKKHVLYVDEAGEPDTIRWADLNTGFLTRMKQQIFSTFFTLVATVVMGAIVYVANQYGVELGAFVIAFFNSVFPYVANALVAFENHDREGSKQTSLFIKIALYRYIVSVIIICVITPFTSTTDFIVGDNESLVHQIHALYYSEIVYTTLLQVSDIFGNINRHYYAPRSATQDAMNIMMQGSEIELAERYTNMTKVVFLTFFYSAIYPMAFALGFFVLAINYFLDRVSLMRQWKRRPKYSSQISRFSRRYFFPVALIGMVTASSYYWSGFPFDNICETDRGGLFDAKNHNQRQLYYDYVGTFNITQVESNRESKNISAGFLLDAIARADEAQFSRSEYPPHAEVQYHDPMYHHCLQDFLPGRGMFRFPFLARFQPKGSEWMTKDQEIVADIFGWLSVAVIVGVVIYMAVGVIQTIKQWFHRTYQPNGHDKGIPFSDVQSINLYVPQVESNVYSYPLLAANVDALDEHYLDWDDPVRPHAFYDLTKDAEVLVKNMDISSKNVFSQVTNWPAAAKKIYKKDVEQMTEEAAK